MGNRWAFTTLCFALVATATAQTFPKTVHPSVVQAFQRADSAIKRNDRQFASALLSGIYYPNGITIALEPAGTAAEASRADRALRRAVAAWERALPHDCPIRMLPVGAKSEVPIQMVDVIREQGRDAMGFINLEKRYQWNRNEHRVTYSGSIQILRADQGRLLTEDELTEIMCHELGHLLGLADVDHADCLMGPMIIGRPIVAPDAEEIGAVRMIRDLARRRHRALASA